MSLLAHAGHWAAQVLYLLPVVAIAVVVLRERRRGVRDGKTGGDERPRPPLPR